MTQRRPALPILLGLTVSLVAVMAACSSGSSGQGQSLPGATSQPGLSRSPVVAPAGLATAGQLTVAADPTEAPLVYYDHNNRFAGFSVELLGEVASQLGLRLTVINIDAGQVVPGLADSQHRYDMGIASQPATPQLAGSALTLPYLSGGQAILARHDDSKIKVIDGLCGAKVGANRNSAGESAVLRTNEGACRTKPIAYSAYDDDVQGVHDLESGKLRAYIQDYSVATAFVRLYTDIRLVPGHFNRVPEVFVFALPNASLHDAVASAFQRLRNSDDYKKLLARWGLTEGAVS